MTEKTMFIRPAQPGADIADPSHGGAPLPWREQGVEVVYDAYWAGHIIRGDVEIVAPPEPEPEPAPAEDLPQISADHSAES